MANFIKDPDAVLDYKFDWSAWLNGDSISSASISVDGLTLDSQSNTTEDVTIFVSEGVVGVQASATCHVITSAGREDDRTMTFKIDER